MGLFVAFLTPLGILGFWALFQKKAVNKSQLDIKTTSFLRVFTLTPLLVFSIFSLSHEIKFNWIGPGLLAVIPWLAVLIYTSKPHLYRAWFITASILLLLYSTMIGCIISGKPEALNRQVLSKYIAWSDLAREVLQQADTLKKPPIIVIYIISQASFASIKPSSELNKSE